MLGFFAPPVECQLFVRDRHSWGVSNGPWFEAGLDSTHTLLNRERGMSQLDAINQIQVDDRADRSPTELLSELRPGDWQRVMNSA